MPADKAPAFWSSIDNSQRPSLPSTGGPGEIKPPLSVSTAPGMLPDADLPPPLSRSPLPLAHASGDRQPNRRSVPTPLSQALASKKLKPRRRPSRLDRILARVSCTPGPSGEQAHFLFTDEKFLVSSRTSGTAGSGSATSLTSLFRFGSCAFLCVGFIPAASPHALAEMAPGCLSIKHSKNESGFCGPTAPANIRNPYSLAPTGSFGVMCLCLGQSLRREGTWCSHRPAWAHLPIPAPGGRVSPTKAPCPDRE